MIMKTSFSFINIRNQRVKKDKSNTSMKNSFTANNRSQSLNTFRYTRNSALQTIAQKNLVSLKEHDERYFINRPLRIVLPPYFNIPKFFDKDIDFERGVVMPNAMNNPLFGIAQQKGLRKKLKDLQILAEGMKRAKNIRQQSRYYFIKGVVLHNAGAFEKSIQLFERFLKIVLFIKDDKSIQLALNSIGNAYMYLNKPQQALHYHEKQYSLNENSQKFIGRVNIALCHEMMKDKSTANKIYAELAETLQNQNDRRADFLHRLIKRTNSQQPQQYFLTENSQRNPTQINTLNRPSHNEFPHRKFYTHKSPQKTKISTQFQNSFNKKKLENAKVNFAIFIAESNFNSYIQDMKDSFIIEN